jgi:hypothetical protein
MRKTNLRINNFFILEDKNKFYLSDIDLLEEWNELSKKDLKPYLKKEVTEKLQELLTKHNCKSNVNFIVDHFNQLEKSLEGGYNSPIKIIKFDGGSILKGG